jgi:hypothetical protein
MAAIHQLMAAAFLGPYPSGYEVNHADADKGNNRLANLEYVTHAENVTHAAQHGLTGGRRGEQHYCAKLREADVRMIRLLSTTVSQGQLARRYHVHPRTIWDICHRNTWKAV